MLHVLVAKKQRDEERKREGRGRGREGRTGEGGREYTFRFVFLGSSLISFGVPLWAVLPSFREGLLP